MEPKTAFELFLKDFNQDVKKGKSSSLSGTEYIAIKMFVDWLQKQKINCIPEIKQDHNI